MELLLLKTIHIIAFVAWFAAMFFVAKLLLTRKSLMLEDSEGSKQSSRQLSNLQWTVYKRIMNPGMMIAWTAGLAMLYFHGKGYLKVNHWMHAKLLLLVLLTVWHVYCKKLIKSLDEGTHKKSIQSLSFMADLPLVFLIAISTLAVFKTGINYLYFGLLTLIAIAAVYIFSKKS
jgi:protoporphyrinogen IX oxidase